MKRNLVRFNANETAREIAAPMMNAVTVYSAANIQATKVGIGNNTALS